MIYESYETAKKLKDAGFPQKHSSIDSNPCHCGVLPQRFHVDIHIPNLEELLEELVVMCGGGFSSLSRPMTSDDKTTYGKWLALGIVDGKEARTLGDTPREAVASLWLALNEK